MHQIPSTSRLRSLLSLGLGVCALVLLAACANPSAGATTQSSARSTSATPSWTPRRTTRITLPSPTPVQGTTGPTVLGAPVSNFIGVYGAPDVKNNNGFTWFIHDQAGNSVKWIDATFQPDGTVSRTSVVNSSDTAWSKDQSIGECSAFLPADATFEQWMDDNGERFASASLGAIQVSRENDMGDCLVLVIGS